MTRYLYNEADNLAGEQSPSGRITRYTYDDDQDLIEETGPLGHKITYDYVKDHRKIMTRTTTQNVTDPAGQNDSQPIVTIEEYNLMGDLAKRTDANGNVFTYTYNADGFSDVGWLPVDL